MKDIDLNKRILKLITNYSSGISHGILNVNVSDNISLTFRSRLDLGIIKIMRKNENSLILYSAILRNNLFKISILEVSSAGVLTDCFKSSWKDR